MATSQASITSFCMLPCLWAFQRKLSGHNRDSQMILIKRLADQNTLEPRRTRRKEVREGERTEKAAAERWQERREEDTGRK